MSNDKKRQTMEKCEVHYRELFVQLWRFFSLRVIIVMVMCFLLIFFTNQLQKSQRIQHQNNVPEHTKEHIDHYFGQTLTQLHFTSKSVSTIIDLQYRHYLTHGKLYYRQKSPLSMVQKMLYLQKYNTTGEYVCLGNCTALQFYFLTLWTKTISLSSLTTIYLKYYDPISNSTNIIYTPSDKNVLSQQEIQSLLKQGNQDNNETLIKIGSQLYFRSQKVFSTSFDPNNKISMGIRLRKSQMERILRSDIELYSFFQYEILDSFEWVSLKSSKSLPFFSYKQMQVLKQISYKNPYSNQQMIKFYFQIPTISIYFPFFKFFLLLPLLVFIFHLIQQKSIIRQALFKFFRKTLILLSLYNYNIQQIFTGNKPKQTIILSDTTITEFYQQLSQLPSSQFQPITCRIKKKVPPKSFLFVQTLKAIVEKYNQYAKSIFRQKNKEIINNKFFIQTSVNELFQSLSGKIKDEFLKARELKSLKRFFRFAYLSLLMEPQEFDRNIEEDRSPIPQEFIRLMREMNRTVYGSEMRKAFKLSHNVLKQTEEELQIRIQINLLQKYLQILKDLDMSNFYAKELNLQSDLQNINEYIQNIKHIFNKHNKNIRTLSR